MCAFQAETVHAEGVQEVLVHQQRPEALLAPEPRRNGPPERARPHNQPEGLRGHPGREPEPEQVRDQAGGAQRGGHVRNVHQMRRC